MSRPVTCRHGVPITEDCEPCEVAYDALMAQQRQGTKWMTAPPRRQVDGCYHTHADAVRTGGSCGFCGGTR